VSGIQSADEQITPTKCWIPAYYRGNDLAQMYLLRRRHSLKASRRESFRKVVAELEGYDSSGMGELLPSHTASARSAAG
jgi:hypothetical protein